MPRSVYRLSTHVDGLVIGGAALANVVPYAAAGSLVLRRCPCNPADVGPFDRATIGHTSGLANSASDVSVAAAVVLPVVGDWLALGTTPELLEDGLVMLESLLVNGALVSITKVIAQRPLPRMYAGQSPELQNNAGGFRSFYSGHTSTAFAALSTAAVTLNLRYDQGIWPWIGVTALGTSVALERVADGRHFYSDVIVGALVGTGVGITVPLLHRRRRETGESFWILPQDGGARLVFAQML